MTQLLRSMPTPAPLKNYIDALLHVADSARPPSVAQFEIADSFRPAAKWMSFVCYQASRDGGNAVHLHEHPQIMKASTSSCT
jgi:hypothetical protein